MHALTKILLCVNLELIYAAYAPDEITYLPGWPTDFPLPSKQYSGYLNFTDPISTTEIHLHYWFVLSEQNPATAQTVLWFNGGPGCSSLDGFFYEHGPFELEESSGQSYAVNGIVLGLREYRWSRIANVLYIEQPVGVGFSYGDSSLYPNNNDENTAQRNLPAVETFFKLYPEYLNNSFYISGESYAGIYVPTLAEQIVKAELAGTYTGAKLDGIAVGNGCTGTELGICGYYFGGVCEGLKYEWQYLLDLAMVNMTMKNEIASACDWNQCTQNTTWEVLGDKCLTLLDSAAYMFGYIDTYNVYGECTFTSDNACSISGSERTTPATLNNRVGNKRMHTIHTALNRHHSKSRRLHSNFGDDDDLFADEDQGPAGCIDSNTATKFVMDPTVQAAIHVRSPGYCWSVCGSVPGWGYTESAPNLPRDVYPTLIKNMKVIIYNGDWDACVPYTDNQQWTLNMGFPVMHAWKPWAYIAANDNTTQVGGYAVKYDVSSLGNKGSFEFMTVRGAGHMVPTDAPDKGFHVLTKLLAYDTTVVYDDDYLAVPSSSSTLVDTLYGQRNAFVVLFVLTFVFFGLALIYLYRENTRLKKTPTGSNYSVNDSSINTPNSAMNESVTNPLLTEPTTIKM